MQLGQTWAPWEPNHWAWKHFYHYGCGYVGQKIDHTYSRSQIQTSLLAFRRLRCRYSMWAWNAPMRPFNNALWSKHSALRSHGGLSLACRMRRNANRQIPPGKPWTERNPAYPGIRQSLFAERVSISTAPFAPLSHWRYSVSYPPLSGIRRVSALSFPPNRRTAHSSRSLTSK